MELTRKYSSGGSFRMKDDFEFDFNDISRASTPMSSMSSRSEGRRREKSSHSVEDYKRKIARLKSELEMERAHSKLVHKEKSSEIKLLRDSFRREKQQIIEETEAKIQEEKSKEVEFLQENIIKKKDLELQQVLRYKEEELKKIKEQFLKEKNDLEKKSEESTKKEQDGKKLEEEIKMLKEQKSKIEDKFKKKCQEQSQKEKEFSRIKNDYDAELRRILSESKKLAMGNLQKLKKAEKALSEGCMSDDEISLSDFIPPFPDVQSQSSSRAPSRSLAHLEDFKLEDLDIDKFLASATTSPFVPLNSTYVLDDNSASASLPSPSPNLVSKSQSIGEADGRSSELRRNVVKKTVNRRLSEEKDRQLQKKVAELQAQIQRLERKISLLKTENETLKKKQDEQKPLEDKIKTLKKRNAELAAIARRLEEKAKHLQQENMKKQKDDTTHQEADHLKKMFARQRAKDLAEHAKAMLTKDREIEDLRKKCQELADQLSNADFLGPENAQMYGEKEELVSIIKQAAKERLQLEKQLAKVRPSASIQADIKKLKELEATNEVLQKEIAKLERAKEDTEKLILLQRPLSANQEIELTQKKIECETLYKEIEREKSKNKELESDLQISAAENTQLTVQVSDLTHRLLELEKVNEECNVLRLNLTEAQHECEIAKTERTTLLSKVENLNSVVQNLQESADKLHQVENEYKSSVQKLQEKQTQIDTLQKIQEDAKEEYELALKSLQDRVIELQQRCHSQENKHRDLTKELETLRALATTNNNKKSRSPENLRNSPLHVHHTSKQPNSLKVEINESFQQQSSSLNETSKLSNSNDSDHVVSTKSLDTGFADDDDVELDNSNEPSPDHPGKDQGNFEDPELSEISKKLKELEATDSEEDNLPNYEDKGDDSGMESNREQKNKNENSLTDESRLSSKKGPIQVFISKYSYDPYQHSPNENPDAELPISAGDYVLVYGDMDEDGFFDAELIDGRRGLVPSNFVDKVADEDLAEFHAAVAGVNQQDEDSNAPNSIQQDLDFDSSEEMEKPETILKAKKKVEKELSSGDVDDLDFTRSSHGEVSRIDLTDDQNVIPFPRNLTLDRQLSTSIVISWKPPEKTDGLEIRSYHVYIDGDFKTAIRGNDRTKALVEDVDSKKVHRVSVRCVTNKGQSKDQHCTLLFGKDAVPAPSHMTVTDITSNSASVSWLPGNSNYQHSISVDGQEVRLVKAGICKYTLTGLVPNSDHTVTVTGKSLSSDRPGSNLSASHSFRTLAGGLPDPPLNVQVEAGPQEGTLLLTWLPVTIDPSGFSNGAMVTGYMVYADGRKTKEAKGATNDHIVLRCDDFRGFIPKQLMVRTLTSDSKESIDSVSVKLPQSLIKEITADAAKTVATEALRKSAEFKQKSPVPKELPDTDDEIEMAFQEVAREAEAAMSPDHLDQSEDDFVDSSSSSELSDIPEVEEEIVLNEETNQNAIPQELSPILVKSRSTPVKVQDERTSPKAKFSPKKVSQKSPVTLEGQRESQSPQLLKSPLRVVPAIEITRDSSTERGPSLDLSDDEIDTGRVSNTSRTSQGKISDRHHNESPRHQRESPRTISHTDVISDKSDKSPQKYVKDMDGRDGYRDGKQNIDKFNDLQNKNSADSPKKHKKEKELSKHRHKHEERPSETNLNPKSDISSRTSPKTISNSPKHKSGKRYSEQDSNANEVILNNSFSKQGPDVSISEIDSVEYEDTGDVDSISGEINPPIEDNRIRLFVALFDYDPEVMSPNVDSLDEELPFKEGQILKIFGDKDTDGFYRGECNGRVGFVPCNMVSEVQVDDPELAEQLLKESQESYNVDSHSQVSGSTDHYLKPVENHTNVRLSPNGIPPMPGSGQSKRMVALYDYDPQELSPNVDAELELPFRIGDIIMVQGEMDEDGFFMGELPNGQKGLVPSNFLTEAPLSDDDVLESASVVSPARSGESLNNLSASRQSDLGIDKAQRMGSNPQVEPLQHDRVDVTPSHLNQNQTSNVPRSVSPEETKQKKKTGGILSKGKNIFKKFTR